MKHLLRHYAVDTVALYLASRATSGLVFTEGIKTLLLAGIGLMAASLIVRPLINLLILPLNLITLGLFKWVSSAVALYLVTLIIPGFKIANFVFLGLSSEWLGIPSFSLDGVFAYVGFSFFISLITSFMYWLIK
ncbi:phage holin family protein [Candidatus Woesebacteria bacterium]|nr:phage holin family protein [Candidatus Woesebacteria bacterium]